MSINTGLLHAMLTRLEKVFAVLLTTEHTWTEKQTFDNYTVLGETSVKVKTVSGTTDAIAGNTVSVAHGVDFTKIISLWVGVNDGTTLFAPSGPDADLFTYTADATNVNVTTGLSATTVLDQPFVATIVYEE